MTNYTGNNVEDAINNGLKALGINKNEADIKIISEGSNGIFGLFKKPAEVAISKKEVVAQPQADTPAADAEKPTAAPKQDEMKKSKADDRFERNFAAVKQMAQYLQAVLDEMGIKATLEVDMPSAKHVDINCVTDKEGLLIGKHGRTINALQELCELYLNSLGVNYVQVLLDTADYRERRLDALDNLAQRQAEDVATIGKAITLDPMPNFERKEVHAALEGYDDIVTYSVGNEPHRKVVIAPRN